MDTQAHSTRRWRDRARSWAVPINAMTVSGAEGKPSQAGGAEVLARAVRWRSRMEARALGLGAVLEIEAPSARAVGANDRLIKRSLDLALAVQLLLLSAPVILVLAIVVRLVSSGPAFFTQVREGLEGEPFRVLKLRTMHLDAAKRLERHLAEHPSAQAEWNRYMKLKHDPRLLPGIGRFMRRWSLDELPQLWNVVKGEMSLVGPRAFPDYHLQAFDSEFRVLRRKVKPGITGYWQVQVRSNGDLEVQKKLDSYYIHNWSLWFDVYILGRTVTTVLKGHGAY